ncbi:MAG: FtsX-like permease family protein [Mycoplasma sp.]
MFYLFKNNFKSISKNKISFISILFISLLNSLLFVVFAFSLDNYETSFAKYENKTYLHYYSLDKNKVSLKNGSPITNDNFNKWFNNTSGSKDLEWTENYEITSITNFRGVLSYFSFLNFNGTNDHPFTFNNAKVDLPDITKMNNQFNINDENPDINSEIKTGLPVLASQPWAENWNIHIGDSVSIFGLTLLITGFAKPANLVSPVIGDNISTKGTNSGFFIINFGTERTITDLNDVENRVNNFNSHVSTNTSTLKSTFVMRDNSQIFSNNFVTQQLYSKYKTPFDDDFKWIEQRDQDSKINILQNSWVDDFRISRFLKTMESIVFFRNFFGISLTLIVSLITAITLKRLIHNSKTEIGILKSLGYSPASIAISYSTLLGFIGILAGLFGALTGFLLQAIVTSLSSDIFLITIPLSAFFVVPWLIGLFFPVVLLVCLGFIFNMQYTTKKILVLTRPIVMTNLYFLSSLNGLLDRLPFWTKFSTNTALKSMSKLATLLLGIMFSTTLLFTAFSMNGLISRNLQESLKPLNYNFEITYNRQQIIDNKNILINSPDPEVNLNGSYYGKTTTDVLTPKNGSYSLVPEQDGASRNINEEWTKNLQKLSTPDIEKLFTFMMNNGMGGYYFTVQEINQQAGGIDKSTLPDVARVLSNIASILPSGNIKTFVNSLINSVNELEANFSGLPTTNKNFYINSGFSLYDSEHDYRYADSSTIIKVPTGENVDFDVKGMNDLYNNLPISNFVNTINYTEINNLQQDQNLPGVMVNQNASDNYGIKIGDIININGQNCLVQKIFSGFFKNIIITSDKNFSTIFFPHQSILDDKLNNAVIYNKYFNNNLSISDYLSTRFSFVLQTSPDNPNVFSASTNFSSFYSVKDVLDAVNLIVSTVQIFIAITVFVFIAIAVIIIMSVIVLIVYENSLFMSIMKVLGYSSGQINKLFMSIYMPSIFIGLGLGVPLSVFAVNYLSNQLTTVLTIGISPHTDIWDLLASISVVVLIVLIAALFSKSLINKIEMNQALKSLN